MTELWASVRPMACHRLKGSLPQQMKETVNAKGNTTKYRCTNNFFKEFKQEMEYSNFLNHNCIHC